MSSSSKINTIFFNQNKSIPGVHTQKTNHQKILDSSTQKLITGMHSVKMTKK